MRPPAARITADELARLATLAVRGKMAASELKAGIAVTQRAIAAMLAANAIPPPPPKAE